jgi:hypothetical protein
MGETPFCATKNAFGSFTLNDTQNTIPASSLFPGGREIGAPVENTNLVTKDYITQIKAISQDPANMGPDGNGGEYKGYWDNQDCDPIDGCCKAEAVNSKVGCPKQTEPVCYLYNTREDCELGLANDPDGNLKICKKSLENDWRPALKACDPLDNKPLCNNYCGSGYRLILLDNNKYRMCKTKYTNPYSQFICPVPYSAYYGKICTQSPDAQTPYQQYDECGKIYTVPPSGIIFVNFLVDYSSYTNTSGDNKIKVLKKEEAFVCNPAQGITDGGPEDRSYIADYSAFGNDPRYAKLHKKLFVTTGNEECKKSVKTAPYQDANCGLEGCACGSEINNTKVTVFAFSGPIDNETSLNGGTADIIIDQGGINVKKDANGTPLPENSIALIAQEDIIISGSASKDMKVDASLIARNGSLLRYNFMEAACNYKIPGNAANSSATSITFNGSIITKNGFNLYYEKFDANGNKVDESGYGNIKFNFNNNAISNPPPQFPAGKGSYTITDWNAY